MRTLLAITFLFVVVLTPGSHAAISRLESTDLAAPRQIRWDSQTITIAFSSSLKTPGPAIKSGSDVIGAARRAIARWSALTNIRFVEVSSNAQSISPGHNGDGVNLITVADTPENNAIFRGGSITGRTRIFYDQQTGEIAEADIVINPRLVSSSGIPLQFSTDGTPGTYDLESTLTHEIGHLLGLDHSSVIGATMQPHQALNGLYKQTAFTERTPSHDDRASLLKVYGSPAESRMIEGVVQMRSNRSTVAAAGAHVWIEDAAGRVVASQVSSEDGSYSFNGIPAGSYRVVAQHLVGPRFAQHAAFGRADQSARNTDEVISGETTIGTTDETAKLILGTSTSGVLLNPQVIGMNDELSALPVQLQPGQRVTLLVGGKGVDQVSADGVSVTSPLIKVDPATVRSQQFGTQFPVISFDVVAAANIPAGEYSIRLQSISNKVAFVVGGITIDPGTESATPNVTDDARFFVRQHYRDLLGREPDTDGLNFWVNEFEKCGGDRDCLKEQRVGVSAAFVTAPEVHRNSAFVFALYHSLLGRRPTFTEFIGDRDNLTKIDNERNDAQLSLAAGFVQRTTFAEQFPASLTAPNFVDAVIKNVQHNSSVDLSSKRDELLSLAEGLEGRAAVVARLATYPELIKTESDSAFVLMQYFTYLRRDADDEGFHYWIKALASRNHNDPNRYTSITCAFVNSTEYQSRFGMLITNNPDQCR